MTRFTRLGNALVPALVVGAALAVANSETPSGGGAQKLSPAATDRAAVEAVAPDLPELVRVFRTTRDAADQIPGGDQVGALQQIGDSRPGENPLLARRLDVAGGRPAYAWPAANAVCYAWVGASACTSTALLRRYGVLPGISQNRGPETDAFALTTDQVAEVEFVTADGRAFKSAVQDNAVLITLPSPPVEVRWAGPGGTPQVLSLG